MEVHNNRANMTCQMKRDYKASNKIEDLDKISQIVPSSKFASQCNNVVVSGIESHINETEVNQEVDQQDNLLVLKEEDEESMHVVKFNENKVQVFANKSEQQIMKDANKALIKQLKDHMKFNIQSLKKNAALEVAAGLCYVTKQALLGQFKFIDVFDRCIDTYQANAKPLENSNKRGKNNSQVSAFLATIEDFQPKREYNLIVFRYTIGYISADDDEVSKQLRRYADMLEPDSESYIIVQDQAVAEYDDGLSPINQHLRSLRRIESIFTKAQLAIHSTRQVELESSKRQNKDKCLYPSTLWCLHDRKITVETNDEMQSQQEIGLTQIVNAIKAVDTQEIDLKEELKKIKVKISEKQNEIDDSRNKKEQLVKDVEVQEDIFKSLVSKLDTNCIEKVKLGKQMESRIQEIKIFDEQIKKVYQDINEQLQVLDREDKSEQDDDDNDKENQNVLNYEQMNAISDINNIFNEYSLMIKETQKHNVEEKNLLDEVLKTPIFGDKIKQMIQSELSKKVDPIILYLTTNSFEIEKAMLVKQHLDNWKYQFPLQELQQLREEQSENLKNFQKYVVKAFHIFDEKHHGILILFISLSMQFKENTTFLEDISNLWESYRNQKVEQDIFELMTFWKKESTKIFWLNNYMVKQNPRVLEILKVYDELDENPNLPIYSPLPTHILLKTSFINGESLGQQQLFYSEVFLTTKFMPNVNQFLSHSFEKLFPNKQKWLKGEIFQALQSVSYTDSQEWPAIFKGNTVIDWQRASDTYRFKFQKQIVSLSKDQILVNKMVSEWSKVFSAWVKQKQEDMRKIYECLCKDLNLQIRKEQMALFFAIVQQMSSKRITVADASCGIGKSIILVLLIYYIRKADKDAKIIVCVPTPAIIWQFLRYCGKILSSIGQMKQPVKGLYIILFDKYRQIENECLENSYLIIDEGHKLPRSRRKALRIPKKIVSVSATIGPQGQETNFLSKIFGEEEIGIVANKFKEELKVNRSVNFVKAKKDQRTFHEGSILDVAAKELEVKIKANNLNTILILESIAECKHFCEYITNTGKNAKKSVKSKIIERREVLVFNAWEKENELVMKTQLDYMQNDFPVAAKIILTTIESSQGVNFYKESNLLLTVEPESETDLDQLFGRTNRKYFTGKQHIDMITPHDLSEKSFMEHMRSKCIEDIVFVQDLSENSAKLSGEK